MASEKLSVRVIDFDDTGAMNEWQYSAAFAHFFHYLYVNFTWMMPNLWDVRDTWKEIDDGLFAEYGVNKGRVAKSMLLTYEEVCKWIEYRWEVNVRSEVHEKEIQNIGDSPFDFTRMQLLENAKLVLTELRSRGDKLCCLSSYDQNVFPDKARFLKIYDYFHFVKLVKGKKRAEDFIEVSGWTPELDDKYSWYAIGNGPGDILPAMEISDNWRGFYIPHGSTSALFKHDTKDNKNRFIPPPIDHPRVVTVRDIKDILKYI